MIPLYFPINSTSLGASAFHIIENLESFSLIPIGGSIDISSFEPVSEFLKQKINQAITDGSESHSVESVGVKLWHPFAALERITKRQILYTFHELDNLTKAEINNLNQQEAIIVPSNFNKKVLEFRGVSKPIFVVPLGVDRNVFYPFEKYANREGPFVFSVAGKFEARKCHLEILQAFMATFANNPAIKLRLCIENRFMNMQAVHQQISERIFNGKIPSNIEFFGWLPTEKDFADFLCHSDCLISPSRGESFNLPLLQALSCGVNVITNADHAHADYITSNNAIIIKSEGLVTAQDNVFFRNDGKTNTGNWVNISTNSIASAMIEAFKKGRSVNVNGIETAKKFQWKNTSQEISKIWETLSKT